MTLHAIHVLAVDADRAVTEDVRRELQQHGMRVSIAADGASALQSAQQRRPDLVVMALDLPDIPGLEVLRRLRANGPLPAILLTDGRPNERARGGPGQALAKPFTSGQLMARVAEMVGGPAQVGGRITAGDLEIDAEQRIVTQGGRELTLTRTEWALLVHLASHRGQVLTSGDILSSVWGPEYRDDLQFLRVWVSRLRTKLGGAGLLIVTVRGVGYVFQPQRQAERAPRARSATR